MEKLRWNDIKHYYASKAIDYGHENAFIYDIFEDIERGILIGLVKAKPLKIKGESPDFTAGQEWTIRQLEHYFKEIIKNNEKIN